MNAFRALLKQLQSLSKKKSKDQAQNRISDRQREELMELRRIAEKEMQSADDVYMRDYIDNLDELLKGSMTSSSSQQTLEET